ncbi:MAG: ferredoxin III, nif-specific [Alphaproteobacteria bacterium]|nr:ferredoxin III, nif-specific [Alphaproteobacteria bacterium]MBF0372418.1 ferredoxin III, nif-specific [Alphaproteobacteria bacterium]MBF0391679.1 ferredoxin III, nif-specific [Alphaproteobacteria bacterium]
MSHQARNRGGNPWTPVYIESIDVETCIGCGRCYKVCGHGVLTLVGVDEDGAFVTDMEDEDEIERKVMMVAKGDDCIGCGACSRVCAKNCQVHAAA